jgi:hypothetical protein
MSIIEILYLVLIVSVVVLTVTIVWVSYDLKALLRSLRHSAEDTERVTKEIKEKVLMVAEALDRAGAAATSIIGLIESSIDQIKEKRDAIASSIGLITGAGKAIKDRRASQEDKADEAEEKEVKEKIKEESEAEEAEKDEPKKSKEEKEENK